MSVRPIEVAETDRAYCFTAIGTISCIILCAAPVVSVRLTDELGDEAAAKSVIQATAQTPTVLRCVVVGGFPPPAVTVALDRRDVSDHFRFRWRARPLRKRMNRSRCRLDCAHPRAQVTVY